MSKIPRMNAYIPTSSPLQPPGYDESRVSSLTVDYNFSDFGNELLVTGVIDGEYSFTGRFPVGKFDQNKFIRDAIRTVNKNYSSNRDAVKYTRRKLNFKLNK